MKVNKTSIIIAVVTITLFTAIPFIASRYVPDELIIMLSTQGFDITDLLNKTAILGVSMGVLVLLKGLVDKTSAAHLGLSIVSTTYWLFITLFALGIGHIETFGLATITSTAGGAYNSVTFDLRLYAGLAAVIVVLKLVNSVLKFQEARKQPQT